MVIAQSTWHKKITSVLFWGFVVSFLGSLPPGTTNILMIQLAATKGYEIAAWFALGCMISEVLCVALCVTIMDRISETPLLMRALEWVSMLVIIWIVVSSFSPLKGFALMEVPEGNLETLLFGIVIMAINPVQLPFWVGWTTILMQRKLLKPTRSDNTQYIIGIAAGSIIASALFIAGGHVITRWIAGRETLIQWIFGLTFVVIALIHLKKIIFRRPAY
jgi:threonine/homoserine/homoserine lactone efflux protein